MASRSSHAPRPKLYRRSIILQLEEKHPGLRAMVEDLLRHRHSYTDIVRQVEERSGIKISLKAVHYFWTTFVGPQERAEAEAFCGARAQVKALLEEVKADPTLDATRIIELLLTNQIVRDRLKLGEADIMALYREQREREKLELQRRALSLREKQVKKMLAAAPQPPGPGQKPLHPSGFRQPPSELLQKVREIYGLSEPPGASTLDPAASKA